jgi:hypothetical protein
MVQNLVVGEVDRNNLLRLFFSSTNCDPDASPHKTRRCNTSPHVHESDFSGVCWWGVLLNFSLCSIGLSVMTNTGVLTGFDDNMMFWQEYVAHFPFTAISASDTNRNKNVIFWSVEVNTTIKFWTL